MNKNPQTIVLALALFASQVHTGVFAQGTAFTYQGRLNNAGSPANGSYDLTFTLFAASSGGTASGGPVTNAATAVTNGLFIATVDFGNIFIGSSNWLEIAVRSNGVGAFTTLSPRNQVTPTPYAISAESVSGGINASQLTNGTVPTGVIAGFQGPLYASVGGGQQNTANNTYAVVAGGFGNTAGYMGAVGGGEDNTASGQQSTVPGGSGNLASGNSSLAAGNMAQATNAGAFVWADAEGTPFRSTNNNSFNVRATGGVIFDTAGTGMKLDGAPVLTSSSAALGITLLQNANGGPTVVEGSQANYAAPGVVGAVISGGGATNWDGSIVSNSVAGNFSTIGGGLNNTIYGDVYGYGVGTIGGGGGNVIQYDSAGSSIGGGSFNAIDGDAYDSGNSVIAGGAFNEVGTNSPRSVIGGGEYNEIQGANGTSVEGACTISGGDGNLIFPSAFSCTIAGGYGNEAANFYATVPGGIYNSASGFASFAAGDDAQAAYSGSFVWSDTEGTLFADTAPNQFLIRAAGGVGVGTSFPQASVDIVSSNGIADPQLRLVQENGTDYARLRFLTGTLPGWDLAMGGPTDQMNWFVGGYGNVMTLTTNGALTVNSLTTGTIVSGGLTTSGITVANDAAIHVSGAGSNTKTAAFVQTVTAANWNGGDFTTINNPLCNGNPNAILIITRSFNNSSPDDSTDPAAVYYSEGQWIIDSNTMNVGDTFNVLVILP